MKPYLISATVIAALGGLLFGFDTAVISGTTDQLTEVYQLNPFWLGCTVASALIGTIVGAAIAGRPADRYGRRTTLTIIAVLYFVSAVGTAFAWDWASFQFFRFLGGIGVGGASVVSPMYIAEISPARLRGRLVAVAQFNIVLGILLAFFSNYLIAQLNLGETEWRWMFGVEAFPAAAFFCLLFVTPRSPRWLMTQGLVAEARETLEKLGTDTGNVEEAISAIQASLDLDHHSLHEPLFRRAYLQPILLAVAIAAFNQLSGINALMYYAPHIFKMAGAGTSAALLQAVAVGGTNLVFTMLAMLVIDHFGRKALMLAGSLGYILSLGSTAWAFYTYGTQFTATGSIVVLRQSVAIHCVARLRPGGRDLGFHQRDLSQSRAARGQALGSFVHWFMAALISWTFPVIADWSGGHTFGFYCAMMVLQLFWVLALMPETKGLPLEEIQKRMGIQ